MFKHFCPCGNPVPAARFNLGFAYCMDPACVDKYAERKTTIIKGEDFYGREFQVEIKPTVINTPKASLKKVRRKIVVNRKTTYIEVELKCVICGNKNKNQLATDIGKDVVCRMPQYCATPLPGARWGA